MNGYGTDQANRFYIDQYQYIKDAYGYKYLSVEVVA